MSYGIDPHSADPLDNHFAPSSPYDSAPLGEHLARNRSDTSPGLFGLLTFVVLAMCMAVAVLW